MGEKHLKKLKTDQPQGPAIHLLGVYPKDSISYYRDQAGLKHTDVHLSCLQVPGLEASVVMPGYFFQYTGKERHRF